MTDRQPKISLIILTYNRPQLVGRAIESIINQTYQDFEIILVDNGSDETTKEVLKKYNSCEKIRFFQLDKNRGFAGGMNYAFDQISGEWFTSLGDDDELVPTAFETFMKVPDEIDGSINAITCNATDSSTGNLSGFGLNEDQYLPIDVVIGKTSGNFHGITKTKLLGNKRFNEHLPGNESTFWYQIDAIANRYYIHKSLKTWCTDHGATESERFRAHNTDLRIKLYKELLKETFYWEALRKYNNKQYIARCLRGSVFMKMGGDGQRAKQYKQMLMDGRPNLRYRLLGSLVVASSPATLRQVYRALGQSDFTESISRLFLKRYTQISG